MAQVAVTENPQQPPSKKMNGLFKKFSTIVIFFYMFLIVDVVFQLVPSALVIQGVSYFERSANPADWEQHTMELQSKVGFLKADIPFFGNPGLINVYSESELVQPLCRLSNGFMDNGLRRLIYQYKEKIIEPYIATQTEDERETVESFGCEMMLSSSVKIDDKFHSVEDYIQMYDFRNLLTYFRVVFMILQTLFSLSIIIRVHKSPSWIGFVMHMKFTFMIAFMVVTLLDNFLPYSILPMTKLKAIFNETYMWYYIIVYPLMFIIYKWFKKVFNATVDEQVVQLKTEKIVKQQQEILALV